MDKEYFLDMGYFFPRQLKDGTWVGITPLMYSYGLHVGLDRFGWKHRYCFETFEECFEQYSKLKTIDDVPDGYIAMR